LAQTEFAQVVQAQPTNLQAKYLWGTCLFSLGKLTEAIAQIEPVYATHSEDLSVAYILANAYLHNNQLAQGEQLVDKVFRKLDSAEAHLIMGTLYSFRHELQPAADELRQAIEANPKLPTAHSQLGVVYLMSGNREQAVQAFQTELTINPNDFIANTRLGWLYREDGKLDEGERLLKRALELRPNDPGPMFQLAQLVNQQGKTEEAAKLLEGVTQILPKYSPAHVLLARLYFKLKRNDDAKREQAIIEKLRIEEQQKQPTAETQKLSDPKSRAIADPLLKPPPK
jgi:tetratricopeptide (TPR) repeat protein